MSTERMSLALEAFVQDVNVERDKEIVLLLDNTGWHRSKKLKVPKGLRLLYLPAYTPELSPAEPVVPLLREGVANRSFADLDEWEETLEQRCGYLMEHPELLRSRTSFHRLPV